MTSIWPPFELTITSTWKGESASNKNLRLVVITDDLIYATSGLEPEDIYGETIPEYAFTWLFGDKTQRLISSAQLRWLHRAQMSPEQWSLDLAVIDAHTDEVIGAVDLRATDFATSRSVETGSFVLHKHQGRGIGTHVRHIVAHLCFDHLGATTIRSGWVLGNAASEAVSTKLGYRRAATSEASSESLPHGPNRRPLPVVSAQLPAHEYRRPDGFTLAVTGLSPQLLALLGAQQQQ